MEENRFHIFQCPFCGHFQVKEIRDMPKAVFKCFKCGRSRKVWKKIMFQLKYYGRYDSHTASDKCAEYKEKFKVIEDFKR